MTPGRATAVPARTAAAADPRSMDRRGKLFGELLFEVEVASDIPMTPLSTTVRDGREQSALTYLL